MQVLIAGNPAVTKSPARHLLRLGKRKPHKENWCGFEPTPDLVSTKLMWGLLGGKENHIYQR